MIDLSQEYTRELANELLQTLLPQETEYKEKELLLGQQVKEIAEGRLLATNKELGISVFELEYKSGRDPRIKLANEAFRIMAENLAWKAIVIFKSKSSPSWRLSYMTIDLDINNNNKVTRNYSNPRRYSFMLGPDTKVNTPTQYLVRKGRVKDIADLASRFSLEVVNKQFYAEIAQLYTELVGGTRRVGANKITYDRTLDLPGDENEQHAQEFAVRLIGRLIFCWFLREKKSSNGTPLVPLELLSKHAADSTSDYYSVLENLFFETLNTEHHKRSADYRKGFYKDVPYLNGGLFEPHKGDYYGRPKNVPDEWLRRLVTTLDAYNFTIDENTSVDIELSIDPEMLGRIFENLLAEINPETGETARKSTGSYYTPRPIVEHMVDQSLVNYLITKTSIGREKLEALISYDEADDLEHPLSEKDKSKVARALDNLRIIDPACGSGAFPIGVLQKVVLMLQRIDPKGQLWIQSKLSGVKDPIIKELLQKKFNDENLDYIRKLGVIRDSIFGVDIQPIATEVSRLRCFLTLIVEEEIHDELPNRDIQPLPNLNFKFVCANSLLPLSREQNVTIGNLNGDLEAKLSKIRSDYFNARPDKRAKLKIEYLNTLQQSGLFGDNESERQLKSFNPFDPESRAEFFDAKFMFGLKTFDIAIANPPYLDSESMTKNNPVQRAYLGELYATAKGNWDIFVIFIELGLSLLDENGTLTYIIPNKLLAAKYTETLRRQLLKRSVLEVRDYSRYKVFLEADIYPIVLICSNTASHKDPVAFTTMSSDSIDVPVLDNHIPRPQFEQDIYWDKYFSEPDTLATLLKMTRSEHSLKDYCDGIIGAATVAEAYEFKNYLRDNQQGLSKAPRGFKRFINTGTTDPYFDTWATSPTQYIKGKYLQPIAADSDIEKVNPNRLSQANAEKLIIAGMSKRIECVYDNGDVLPGKSTSVMLASSVHDTHIFFLLALLNSRAVSFWFTTYFKSLAMAGGYINVNQNELQQVPIPTFSSEEEKEIISLVERIYRQPQELDVIVKKIDMIVYGLYRLTPEEISTVEGH